MPRVPGTMNCPACGAGPFTSVGDLQRHIADAHPTPPPPPPPSR